MGSVDSVIKIKSCLGRGSHKFLSQMRSFTYIQYIVMILPLILVLFSHLLCRRVPRPTL